MLELIGIALRIHAKNFFRNIFIHLGSRLYTVTEAAAHSDHFASRSIDTAYNVIVDRLQDFQNAPPYVILCEFWVKK